MHNVLLTTYAVYMNNRIIVMRTGGLDHSMLLRVGTQKGCFTRLIKKILNKLHGTNAFLPHVQASSGSSAIFTRALPTISIARLLSLLDDPTPACLGSIYFLCSW